MPTVKLIGHDYAFSVSDVLTLFFEECKCQDRQSFTAGSDFETVVYSSISEGRISTWIEGRKDAAITSRAAESLPLKREVKRQMYLILSILTGRTFPWGSLTGIRPTVIAREVKSAEELCEKYFVRADKANLAFETKYFEDRVLDAVSPDLACGYIGIPFCSSRCSYCSFISQESAGHLQELSRYSDAVIEEIDAFYTDNPVKLSCLYFGGGTPTVFDDTCFHSFMERTFSCLHAEEIPEITVEAGRPDSITENKLRTMKNLGVNRICINPQTMSDRTLKLLHRNHCAEDFYRAFHAARKIGFATINTDLIVGLPNEREEDFIHSLEAILSLNPENITIHTLSKKRTSSMAPKLHRLTDQGQIDALDGMHKYAQHRLKETGYTPYYLYKQKDTLGGHENTGYTMPGHACIYNVAMMSDQRSILAFGAGSISKRAFAASSLERCPNVKDVHEYMNRTREMAERKRKLFDV